MTSLNQEERPVFASARLKLEPVTRQHAAEMTQLLDSAEVYRYLDQDPPQLAFLERQYRLLESGTSPDGSERWLTWICRHRQTSLPVGFIQSTVRGGMFSIAYVIGHSHWRQGFAREAISALLEEMFARYSVEYAQAEMDTRNIASIALVEALGFQRTKLIPAAGTVHGEPSDEYEYVLSRSQHAIQRRAYVT